MSVEISNRVWVHSLHTGTASVAMLALADMADHDGYCWPAIKKLAQMCNCSERQAQRVIAELVESSGEVFLPKEHGGGRTQTRHATS